MRRRLVALLSASALLSACGAPEPEGPAPVEPSAAPSPALPAAPPSIGRQDAYWPATTSFFECDWAWVLYLDKGACGVGHKPGRTFFLWPVGVPVSG